MPSLTAELLGTAAVVAGLLLIAISVDPKLRATRAANRITRKRRHVAATGCRMCRLELEAYDAGVELAKLEARAAAFAEHVDEQLAAQGLTRDDRGSATPLVALAILALIFAGMVYADPATSYTDVRTALTAILEGAHR